MRKKTSIMTQQDEYFVRHISEVQTVPCMCGSSTRIIPSTEGLEANVHLTHIVDSKLHYHKKSVEIYYIVQGSGKMVLRDQPFDSRAGSLIYIPREVPHRGYGDFKALIVGIPPVDSQDEFLLEEA